MDKEVLDRFELINKRIDDNKTMIQVVVSAGTALFAVLAIVFTWNFNSEKQDLRASKDELKGEVLSFIGKNALSPKILLFTADEAVLEGSVIPVKVDLDHEFGNAGLIEIPIILRNDGRGSSGEVTVKAYTKDGIELWSKAAFEDEYLYESYWQGKSDTGVPDLPPNGYAHPYAFTLYPAKASSIEPNLYPVKIKIYYGSGLVAESTFQIDVTENLIYAD